MGCQKDTCAMIFFGIVGAIALIALISTRASIVPEYNFGKEFEMATCRVGSVDYLYRDLPCQYCYTTSTYTCTKRYKIKHKTKNSGKSTSTKLKKTKDCRTHSKTKCRMSMFPCLMINITYDFGDGLWNEALLHYDQDHLKNEPRCSYKICEANPSYSRKKVEDYASKYRAMKADEDFTCFINPALDTEAIETKKYTKSQVFHGTLWPALILAICILILIALGIRKYRQNQKDAEKKEEKEKADAESMPLKSGAAIPPPEAVAAPVPPPGYTPTAQPYGPPPNAGYPYPQPAAMPPPQQPYPPPQGMGYPPPQPGYYPQPGTYPPPQGVAYAPPQDGGQPYPPPGAAPAPFEAEAAKV